METTTILELTEETTISDSDFLIKTNTSGQTAKISAQNALSYAWSGGVRDIEGNELLASTIKNHIVDSAIHPEFFPWVDCTYLNDWFTEPVRNVPLSYCRKGNIVFLRGCVCPGLAALIATLPESFRPSLDQEFPTLADYKGSNELKSFRITADGQIYSAKTASFVLINACFCTGDDI